DCSLHVETKRIGLAGGHPPPPFGRRNAFGGARIDGGSVRVIQPNTLSLAFRHHRGNLRPRLERWINEALALEPHESCAIVGEVLALAPDRLLPGNAEPGKVLVDRLLIGRPAAYGIDILDAEEKGAFCCSCHIEVDERRESVTEMKIAVRARRKTKYRG